MYKLWNKPPVSHTRVKSHDDLSRENGEGVICYLCSDWQAVGHQQAGQPLLIGWAPGKGRANAKGTLAPTEAPHWSKLWEHEGREKRERVRKIINVIMFIHFSVVACGQKVAIRPLAACEILCDHQPAVSQSVTKNYTFQRNCQTPKTMNGVVYPVTFSAPISNTRTETIPRDNESWGVMWWEMGWGNLLFYPQRIQTPDYPLSRLLSRCCQVH